MKPESFDGLLVVDKPAGMTSRDAVDRAARWFPKRTRIGHTGTLDPLATGVLVLCVGVATRLSEYVQRMAKTYDAGLLLGVRSDTDDADGTVQSVAVTMPPSGSQIAAALRSFIGAVPQVPPAYSAAKLTGRRAYALARRGEEVVLQPREVEIYRVEINNYEYPRLRIEVHCGKGTYIRSLARDLGSLLGCGAMIETLRRTRVGKFDVSMAIDLDADAAEAHRRLLPLAAAVADLPAIALPPEALAQIRQGKAVLSSAFVSEESREVAVFDLGGHLAAIAQTRKEGMLQPLKVLSVARKD
ncbi:MAG TPA: tRNA pseudouridine(55) synthase TruB [Gemmataceae bacterium]|jgi:tRNA pseudouridine55 synthase